MRSVALNWSVLVFVALATIAAAPHIQPVIVGIAAALIVVAFAGTIRRASWGKAATTALCWLALVVSFFLSVPDREVPPDAPPSIVQAILGHPPSLFELFVGVGVAVVPWLVCLHIIGSRR